MRVRELENLVVEAIRADPLPGLTDVTGAGDTSKYTRVAMTFDGDTHGYVMVRNVTPPGGRRTPDYDMTGVL